MWTVSRRTSLRPFKEQIYYDAVKQHAQIKTHVELYERGEDEVPKPKERSYVYLYESINKFLRRQRKEKVRQQQSAHIEEVVRGRQPATPWRAQGRREG